MDSYSVRGDLLAEQNEQELVAALRAGDETAFVALVDRYHPSLVRLARMYVRQPSVAEEVAQETWLAVLNGIDRFEGRSRPGSSASSPTGQRRAASAKAEACRSPPLAIPTSPLWTRTASVPTATS